MKRAPKCDPRRMFEHKCGWPFRLPRSSTIVHCNLPLCHPGPYCKVMTMEGEEATRAPRFGVCPLTSDAEEG